MVSFLEGFFLTIGAMASAGIVLFPIVLIIGASATQADRLQTLVAARPFVSGTGLVLSLFISYFIYQWKSDPLFRRGLIVAVIVNVLSTIGSI